MIWRRRNICSSCCKDESLALYGRDMRLLEEILARKQSLIVLLEQHGKKRSEILISLGLPADHDGLAQLASHSSVGDQLLAQSSALNQLLAQCQEANLLNGQSIQLQQATTANQLTHPPRRRTSGAVQRPRFHLTPGQAKHPQPSLTPVDGVTYPRCATYWQNAGSCV